MRYKGIKGNAWEAVRASVRRREKHCYTCVARDLVGINAQAGHYFPVGLIGSNNTLSWDERLIHLQCSRCNGPGQGMQVRYREHLVRDYGEKAVAGLEQMKYRVSPIKDWNGVIARFEAL